MIAVPVLVILDTIGSQSAFRLFNVKTALILAHIKRARIDATRTAALTKLRIFTHPQNSVVCGATQPNKLSSSIRKLAGSGESNHTHMQ